MYLAQPGAGRVEEGDGREDPVVVLVAGRPGDLAVAAQPPDVVPQGVLVLGLVDLDEPAVVVERHGRGLARVVPAVACPGDAAVRAVGAGPVPQRAGARIVHLDNLAAPVESDRRTVSDIPLVLDARPAVAGQERQDT